MLESKPDWPVTTLPETSRPVPSMQPSSYSMDVNRCGEIRALTISQDWAARSVSSQMEKGKETLDIFSKIDINLKSICVQN